MVTPKTEAANAEAVNAEAAADSVVSGPPLSAVSHLMGGPRVDDLLRRAAERAPAHCAVRSAAGDVSYAQLDAEATRVAAALRAVTGGPGVVTALALQLDPVFPAAFFGIVRAGNVAALVNPLLRTEGLTHVLRASHAQAAIVPPAVYRRLAATPSWPPELKTVILTHGDSELDPDAAGLPTLSGLMDQAPAAGLPPADRNPDAVACLQFTSGTTGPAKVVQLTHANITVNAAQTAYAHRVTDQSAVFDYLPTFHLMHLTIPVTAGATLVLWPEDDIAGSIAAAERYDATHYYSLPVRLARLAGDPRLSQLKAPGLRAILSGGSALPAKAAATLARHFGIPVVQGYGLQETSPSTHFDNLDEPRARSCGLPLAGTDCRVLNVDTRALVPVGCKGEIQVRGPQLMKGYLGRERAQDISAEGWFSTGDIGYLDSDGYLFIADRIKDVFKCDNWLVSPTEIEDVLRRHPGVADCVVVDYPDELSGAVAYGLVVPSDSGVDKAVLTEFIAAQLPYYQHLRYLDFIPDIRRSPTGKVDRRKLRDQVKNNGPK